MNSDLQLTGRRRFSWSTMPGLITTHLALWLMTSVVYSQPADREWLASVIDSNTLVVVHAQPSTANLARLGVRLRNLLPSRRATITKWFSEADRLKSELAKNNGVDFAVVLSTHSGKEYAPLYCTPNTPGLTADRLLKIIGPRYTDGYVAEQFFMAWMVGKPEALSNTFRPLRVSLHRSSKGN